MSDYNSDDPGERARVYGRIAPLILKFAGDHAGKTFHVEELRRYVQAHVEAAPNSPYRILYELKQEGKLNYEVISRPESLYQFRPVVLRNWDPKLDRNVARITRIMTGYEPPTGDNSMTSHSPILGGSTAQRRLSCPASFLEEKRSPIGDIESVYAAEGTMLHGVITHFVKHKVDGTALRTWDIKKIGKFDLTDEQTEALAVALDELEMLKEKYKSPNGVPWKVVALEMSMPLPGVFAAFGSVDLVLANDVAVLIVDWKFGQGVPVSAYYEFPDGIELNPQAAFYACCARGHPRLKRHFKGRQIVLAIIQPRITPPSSHIETDHAELDGFVEAFKHAVAASMERNAHRERGDWCRFAICKATCPLWTGPVFDLSKLDPTRAALRASAEGDPTEYGAYLSTAMELAEIAEIWAKEVREQSHVFLEDGGMVRGWKLVPKRGSRQWRDTAENTVAALRSVGALDADIYTVPELKSVAQVEKALKPKKITLPVEMFHTISTGSTIARSDDARPDATHATVVDQARQALGRI